jgi:hypothetical protein
MFKALRYFGWPLLAGVLIAVLIIQRFPEWVGCPARTSTCNKPRRPPACSKARCPTPTR